MFLYECKECLYIFFFLSFDFNTKKHYTQHIQSTYNINIYAKDMKNKQKKVCFVNTTQICSIMLNN